MSSFSLNILNLNYNSLTYGHLYVIILYLDSDYHSQQSPFSYYRYKYI